MLAPASAVVTAAAASVGFSVPAHAVVAVITTVAVPNAVTAAVTGLAYIMLCLWCLVMAVAQHGMLVVALHCLSLCTAVI